MQISISRKFTFLSLIKFSLPAIGMLILTSIYTAVDGIFVSRFVGSDALSSINIVLPLDGLMTGAGIMFATGGSAIIGRKLGEGKEQEARENFTLITIAATIAGVIGTLFILMFLSQTMGFLGASERLLPYCTDYGRILFAFAVPYVLQVMFGTLFVTAGKPNLALVVTLICGIMNVVLDYLFIAVWDMGISGAAWGTVISRSFGGIFALIYFAATKDTLRFTGLKWSGRVIWQTISNGSSEMVSNVASGITTFLFNITMMKMIGEDGVAAMTIVLYTQFIYTAIFFGFANSSAPIISFNYGSKDIVYLKKVFRYSMGIIGGSTLIMLLCSILFAKPLLMLFTTPESSVYRLAYHGYLIFIWNFIFAGFNIFASSLFSALSNGLVSAGISFLRTFVFMVGAILILPQFIGINGIWLAVPAAEFLTCIIAIVLTVRYGRKQYHYM